MPRGGVWKLEAGSSASCAGSAVVTEPAHVLRAAPVSGLSALGAGVSVNAGLSTILQAKERGRLRDLMHALPCVA
jgi:hypothetical protein